MDSQGILQDLTISTKDVEKTIEKEQILEQVHTLSHKLRSNGHKGRL